MDSFERDCQYVRTLATSSPPVNQGKWGSDDCPASRAFAAVCDSSTAAVTSTSPLLDFQLTYVSLLHEFWQHIDETEPEHHPCLFTIFAATYKTIRKRELRCILTMTLQPPTPPQKGPDYPDLAGFDEEEDNG